MTHVYRLLFLSLVAVTAALFLSLTQGCAGSVTPESVVTGISHVAAREQDVEQRLAKGYNALCAEREANVECVALAQILEEINIGKQLVFDELAKLIASVNGEVVYVDSSGPPVTLPPEPRPEADKAPLVPPTEIVRPPNG